MFVYKASPFLAILIQLVCMADKVRDCLAESLRFKQYSVVLVGREQRTVEQSFILKKKGSKEWDNSGIL